MPISGTFSGKIAHLWVGFEADHLVRRRLALHLLVFVRSKSLGMAYKRQARGCADKVAIARGPPKLLAGGAEELEVRGCFRLSMFRLE